MTTDGSEERVNKDKALSTGEDNKSKEGGADLREMALIYRRRQ